MAHMRGASNHWRYQWKCNLIIFLIVRVLNPHFQLMIGIEWGRSVEDRQQTRCSRKLVQRIHDPYLQVHRENQIPNLCCVYKFKNTSADKFSSRQVQLAKRARKTFTDEEAHGGCRKALCDGNFFESTRANCLIS